MRTVLLLAALAACLCAASAGPYKVDPGCYKTDTVRSYPIKGASFVDFVKGQFVDMAYIQARKRGRAMVEAMYPVCTYIGHTPKHACYNSIVPGGLGPAQVQGQYGFVFWANLKCPGGRVYVPCKARLDTNRSNRPLAVPGRPGSPSFWGPPRVECA